MSTIIYSTDKYVDLVPMGKRLFLSPGIFNNVDITNKIVSVQRTVIGSQTNMPDAIIKGTIGTAMAGLIGTVIGVALAKEDLQVLYIIKFVTDFDPPSLSFITNDKYLDGWLVRWMERRIK